MLRDTTGLKIHIGMDSICILRDRIGFDWNESAKNHQDSKTMPTATIEEAVGRLKVCFAAVRKLMEVADVMRLS